MIRWLVRVVFAFAVMYGFWWMTEHALLLLAVIMLIAAAVMLVGSYRTAPPILPPDLGPDPSHVSGRGEPSSSGAARLERVVHRPQVIHPGDSDRFPLDRSGPHN